jgi:hypothetical protein
MDDTKKSILEDEAAKGRRASAFRAEFVDAFLADARLALFVNFQTIPMEKSELLMECKRLLGTLDTFEQSINSFIDTGKLARASLELEK